MLSDIYVASKLPMLSHETIIPIDPDKLPKLEGYPILEPLPPLEGKPIEERDKDDGKFITPIVELDENGNVLRK